MTKIWLAAGVAVGLLSAGGVWLWKSGAASNVALPVKVAEAARVHSAPWEVSASTLARLHQEALQHFYADPRNGYGRMPLVFEKVVKPWPETWWSPGDLDRSDAEKPGKDLEIIHTLSVHDFLSPALAPPDVNGPGITIISSGTKANEPVKNWEAKSVDLIGLLKRETPVAYISEKIPDMKELSELPTRPLDMFEIVGLETLRKGDELFSRSQDGVVRLLGAVRARTDCLACHSTKKEGDLLGAFSYTLREAEYKRPGFGGFSSPAK